MNFSLIIGCGGGGIGYISPFHVRNDEVSTTRWKPWMVGRDASEQPVHG